MRIEVGVGSRVRLTLAKPVARMVALAGVQFKCEAVYAVEGVITAGAYTGGETPDGRREVRFTVRESDGAEWEIAKSNVVEAVALS